MAQRLSSSDNADLIARFRAPQPVFRRVDRIARSAVCCSHPVALVEGSSALTPSLHFSQAVISRRFGLADKALAVFWCGWVVVHCGFRHPIACFRLAMRFL